MTSATFDPALSSPLMAAGLIDMKIVFVLTLIFAGFSLSGSSQTPATISSIRSEVNLINRSGPRYRTSARDVEGVTLEGTRATYFTSGKELKKIVGRMYGETFRATAELFYSGEELIFAFQRLEKYDTQIAMDPPPKVTSVIETRVYYSGGKAIRVIEGGKTLPARSADFVGAEEGLLDLSNTLRAAMSIP